METLTIGQLARGPGLNVETIRFYERRGLLARRLLGGRHHHRPPLPGRRGARGAGRREES